MPTPYIQKLSIEVGISVEDLEKKWEEARLKAKDDTNYAIITTIFKRMLGLKESYNFVSLFSSIHEIRKKRGLHNGKG